MNKTGLNNEELIKALGDLGIPLEVLVDNDIEKAEGMSSEDYDKMDDEKKAGYMKKGDMYYKKEKEKDDIKKALEEEEKNKKELEGKGNNTDLVKAISDLKEDLHKRDDSLIEKAVAAVEEKYSSRIDELEKALKNVGEQRVGKKTITNAQFLQKGPKADEDGNTSLSMILNKSAIEKAIGELIDSEEDDEIQKGMENELLVVNTNARGDAELSQVMTDKLLTEKKIIVTK